MSFTIKINTQFVETKFLDYTVEELVDDQDFLLWLNRHSENHQLNKLVGESPQFALKVRKAREIILLIKVKEESVLQDDIYSLWEKVEEFDKLKRSGKGIRHFRVFLRYAAAIVIVMMLSTIVFWKLKQNEEYVWVASDAARVAEQSTLILSTGEEIDLKKDESSIRVNGSNQVIQINNDSIISLSSDRKAISKEAMNQVVVPFGKKSIIELADGTKVWLNAGSRMAFPDRFLGSNREVFLEGEAYFEVSPDTRKPFFVRTKEIVIRVLGTKFNLSAYDADPNVMTVLVEGTVSMSENRGINLFGKEFILHDSQSALFNKTDLTTIVKKEAHVEDFTAWTSGWFTFKKEPLNMVFKKLERYYNVHFVYNERFPSGDIITGKLDLKESIEEVMKVLADLAQISYKIDQKNIFIEQNK